jgi:lysophospholipase L1-like esterase
MKRILFVVALMSVVLAGCSKGPANPYAKPDWFTNANYFEEKDGMYEEMPVGSNSIVMVGDDYIDRGMWSEFFGDTAIKNRGITYDATEHVLYRIHNIAIQHPAKIFVSVGWNDIVHQLPKEQIVENIENIFKQIHKLSPATKCYWMNIVSTNGVTAEMSADIDYVNAEVAKRAEKGKFGVIDIQGALLAGIRNNTYSWDGGTFLNGAGYEALAQAIELQIGKEHLNHANDREYPLEVSDYYKHRVSVFRSLPETEHKIVMLGNSLNNNALWEELFPMGYIINRGISGDVVDGVCQRLDEIIPDQPAKIFLITGTNDFINNPEKPAIEVWNSYEKLIQTIRKEMPDTKLYVQSTLPLNPKSKFYEGFNERAAELNKLLEAGGDRYNYYYLDIASLLSDENGDLAEMNTTDGIHLSAIGYFKWATELAKGPRMNPNI